MKVSDYGLINSRLIQTNFASDPPHRTWKGSLNIHLIGRLKRARTVTVSNLSALLIRPFLLLPDLFLFLLFLLFLLPLVVHFRASFCSISSFVEPLQFFAHKMA